MTKKSKRIVTAVLIFALIVSTVAVSECIGSGSKAKVSGSNELSKSSGFREKVKEETWLKLVPADAVLAGALNVSALDDLKDLMKEIPYKGTQSVYDAYLNIKSEIRNETGIDPDNVSRVILVITKFQNFSDDEPIFAIYAEGHFDTSKVEEKIKNETSGNEIKVEKYKDAEIYYSTDHNEPVIALTGGYIILGSNLSIVEEIIDLKNGKGEWARQYEDVVSKVGSGNLIIVENASYLFRYRLMKSNESNETDKVKVKIVEFLSKLEYSAFRFKVDGGNYSTKMVIRAKDAATAEHFVKNANALLTLFNTSLDAMESIPADLVETLHDMIGRVKVRAEGKYIIDELSVKKEEMDKLIGYLESLKEYPTSNYTTTEPVQSVK